MCLLNKSQATILTSLRFRSICRVQLNVFHRVSGGPSSCLRVGSVFGARWIFKRKKIMIRTSITHRNSSIYFNHGYLFDKRFRNTLVSIRILFFFCSRSVVVRRRANEKYLQRTASHVSACLTGCSGILFHKFLWKILVFLLKIVRTPLRNIISHSQWFFSLKIFCIVYCRKSQEIESPSLSPSTTQKIRDEQEEDLFLFFWILKKKKESRIFLRRSKTSVVCIWFK